MDDKILGFVDRYGYRERFTVDGRKRPFFSFFHGVLIVSYGVFGKLKISLFSDTVVVYLWLTSSTSSNTNHIIILKQFGINIQLKKKCGLYYSFFFCLIK